MIRALGAVIIVPRVVAAEMAIPTTIPTTNKPVPVVVEFSLQVRMLINLIMVFGLLLAKVGVHYKVAVQEEIAQ